MIVVKLNGGLGNQLFQYAFGRYLSIQHQVPLKLDVSALHLAVEEASSLHHLPVAAFNIVAELATPPEIAAFQKSKWQKMVDYASLSVTFKTGSFYLREPHFHFFEKALHTPANAYIDGYWQSERYFLPVRKQLLSDFTLARPLSQQSSEIAMRIKSGNAVSLHVRRGDYISVSKNKQIYETGSPQYYEAAIKAVSTYCKHPTLYVFSDEPQWFSNNIATDLPVVIINHNGDMRNYEDIYLMSLCKHNIIANSSFSWWGAWLNQNEDKRVIAPSKWFKNNLKNTKDLLPAKWIQL